jgi:molybdate transport system ATP-binding protein
LHRDRRRRDFLALLRELSNEQSLPMVVVTHNIDDAAELANDVIAMRDGRIIACGAAADIMSRSEFAGLLDRRDLGARVPADAVSGGAVEGVWVRADSVLLASERPRGISARHVWEGRVDAIAREDARGVLVSLATEAGYILSRITPEALADLQLEQGKQAWAVVKAHAI